MMLNNLVYVCKEIFDENSEPTKYEIEEQAFRLGIDPVNEWHLLSIAKQCLLEPLPSNWFPCYIEKENKYFYYNDLSKISQWEHPLDEYYRQIVEKTRSEDPSTGQDISLNIILDDDNSLDTMYHTKNNNYEKKAVTEKRTVRFKTPIEESLDIDNSDDSMKFLGPIKLNTPYSTSPTTLQNTSQFMITNTFDTKNSASRSVLSKYNVLPNKNESSRKSDLEENNEKTNLKSNFKDADYSSGKINLKKIDITLTESSDRSESTSTEIYSENINSDIDDNDPKEKHNVITKIKLNKRTEKIDVSNDVVPTDYFDDFKVTETKQPENIKKDFCLGENENSKAKDSNIMQSLISSNNFAATKNKVAEVTQRFPLNQFTNEKKLLNIKPLDNDGVMFSQKLNSEKENYKSKSDLTNNLNNEKLTPLNVSQIKLLVENHCDYIKNKLEDTIKIKENIFREEIIKTIDDTIREKNNNFERHIEMQNKELNSKNELEIKNLQRNVQESTEKLLAEVHDKKLVQNVSNTEQIYVENLNKFKKDLENHALMFKNQIQSELDKMSNQLKKDFCKDFEPITDNWNQTLESFKNIELEKVRSKLEQSTENIKRETDDEVHRINLEFKEKLKVISEDKYKNATEQLDLDLREEINSVRKRISENYQFDLNNQVPRHKSQPKRCINCSEQEFNSNYETTELPKINYNDIRKKIQHCSNELNEALKLVNEISTDKYVTGSEKCAVSCQTDNMMTLHQAKLNIKEYTYPNSSNFSSFLPYTTARNNTDFWNQAKTSHDIFSNYLTTYSHSSNPLDILTKEESKVKAVEQNICHLIDTLSSLKHTNAYDVPNYNTDICQNRFIDIYQDMTPKQIAYNRTKDLREWLYKTDFKNKRI